MPWSWWREIWAFGVDLGVEAAWTFVALWTTRGLLLWVFTKPVERGEEEIEVQRRLLQREGFDFVNRHHLGQDRGEERLALGGAVDRLPQVGPEGSDAESDGPPPLVSDSEDSAASDLRASRRLWTNYAGEASDSSSGGTPRGDTFGFNQEAAEFLSN